MAQRTALRMLSRAGPVASPMAMPMPYWRIVPWPTNDPKFTDAPVCSMARSQLSNPSGPPNRAIRSSARVSSSVRSESTFSLMGALVEPSPMISVVMPCVTLLTTRPSPRSNAPREWLWMSMNPGATTKPRASIRPAAPAPARAPAWVMRTMRSPRTAMSP